jgi:E3 ubiquitin-protein ligase RBBP6
MLHKWKALSYFFIAPLLVKLHFTCTYSKILTLPTADEQWNNNYPDFGAENFAGMPLGPPGNFNPYWGGGMPLPMDYMGAPFPGPMPYMGYPPGPFDPFGGGVLPQDPFMPPGYMMPTIPRYIS